MRQFPVKHKPVEYCVTERTPEREARYSQLLRMFHFAMFADGIKSFVIQTIRMEGLWGLSGESTFAGFCEKVLKISERKARSMVLEGAIVRQVIEAEDDIKELLASYNSGKISRFCNSDGSALAVVGDRKSLRALAKAPPDKRKPIVDAAVKSGVTDHHAIEAAVAKCLPKPEPKPAPKVDREVEDAFAAAAPEQTVPRSVRDSLRILGEQFVSASKADDVTLANIVAAGVQTLRTISKALKKKRATA